MTKTQRFERIRLIPGALFAALLVVACGPKDPPADEQPLQQVADVERVAAVAIPDKYGAQVAEDVLRAGGNAVDAAVAVGFSLAVTYPIAGNIGGGGLMMIHKDGQPEFVDYREKAPLAADRDMYLDVNGDFIERSSLVGSRAAGVPGTVAGLWAAHQRHGTLPWKDLVMPAVTRAEEGFMPHQDLVDDVNEQRDWFGDATNFADYFGSISTEELFRQPELATTLRRVAEQGPDGFYRGETADLFVAQMERSSGLITAEDLDSYGALRREPLRVDWREYERLAAPPASSGGFALVQLLKMKDYLAHFFEGVQHNSPQYIHLVAERE